MLIGWQKHNPTYYSRTWAAPDGTQNIITIAKVVSGWSCIWQRGPGYTIHEAGGFPTLEACVEDMWRCIFERSEQQLVLLREQAQRIVNEGKTA